MAETNLAWQRSYLVEEFDRSYSDPECNFWRRQARGAQAALREEIGREAYDQFAHAVWPDGTPIRTWKEIHDQVKPALSLAVGNTIRRQPHDIDSLILASKAVQS